MTVCAPASQQLGGSEVFVPEGSTSGKIKGKYEKSVSIGQLDWYDAKQTDADSFGNSVRDNFSVVSLRR
jgi:hypothetical protein